MKKPSITTGCKTLSSLKEVLDIQPSQWNISLYNTIILFASKQHRNLQQILIGIATMSMTAMLRMLQWIYRDKSDLHCTKNEVFN